MGRKIQVASMVSLRLHPSHLPRRPEKIMKHFGFSLQLLFALLLDRNVKSDERTLQGSCQWCWPLLWEELIKKVRVRESNRLMAENFNNGN